MASSIKSKEDAAYAVQSDDLIPLVNNAGTVAKSATPAQIAAASGVPKMVLLDKPIGIIGPIVADTGAWVAYDMSAGGGFAAAAAGATAAILRISLNVSATTSIGQADASVHLQKKDGGAVWNDDVVRVSVSRAGTISAASIFDSSISEVVIPLDANSDFDYSLNYTNTAGGGSVIMVIYLVGYYV